MGPPIRSRITLDSVDLVRAKLLTALHVDRYKPGDRVPSIRRMAELTKLNHKTVHRAYGQLAEEGLLEIRWGSGTFFKQGDEHRPLPISLLEAAERCRVEADHLGVSPEVFLRFLDRFIRGGLRDVEIAVAECNREQIGLIERELRAAMGLQTREVLLSDLVARHPSLLNGVQGVVTTDCHRQEVIEMVAPLGIPVYRVALSPEFTNRLLKRARMGPLAMLVRDGSYGAVFLRMLRQMQVPAEIVDRIRVATVAEWNAGPRRLRDIRSLYVSPLVAREIAAPVPSGVHRLKPVRYLAATSIDSFKAQLALDLASRRPG